MCWSESVLIQSLKIVVLCWIYHWKELGHRSFLWLGFEPWAFLLNANVFQSTDPDGVRLLRSFRQQLCHFLFEIYTKARINQLFNIMIEFPDSQPALEDLKECLAKTDLRFLFFFTLLPGLFYQAHSFLRSPGYLIYPISGQCGCCKIEAEARIQAVTKSAL